MMFGKLGVLNVFLICDIFNLQCVYQDITHHKSRKICTQIYQILFSLYSSTKTTVAITSNVLPGFLLGNKGAGAYLISLLLHR